MVQEERATLLQKAQRQSYFMTGKYENNSGWDERKDQCNRLASSTRGIFDLEQGDDNNDAGTASYPGAL